ncbi:hypothetical protein SAMN05428962_5068 [Paenibacillus sp. BC26]|nr:hypothetical protein SAMN05428962_5068 [Paenibacillus sp. BC26]
MLYAAKDEAKEIEWVIILLQSQALGETIEKVKQCMEKCNSNRVNDSDKQAN